MEIRNEIILEEWIVNGDHQYLCFFEISTKRDKELSKKNDHTPLNLSVKYH